MNEEKSNNVKAKSRKTTLHEIVVSFAGFEKRLIRSAYGEEAQRIESVLENDEPQPNNFYGMDLRDGLECYINLSRVAKINVLDSLPGVEIDKAADKTDVELQEDIEARNESNESVIIRFWFVDGTIEEFGDIDYQDWCSIRFALEEEIQRFVGFTDEDGERVIVPVSNIAAVEVFDSYYLSDEELSAAMNDPESAADGRLPRPDQPVPRGHASGITTFPPDARERGQFRQSIACLRFPPSREHLSTSVPVR
jgi:hypothetical protein